MFGKRARKRPPMMRTTSMTEFSWDDLTLVMQPPPPPTPTPTPTPAPENQDRQTTRRLNRRNSADFVLEANGTFLRTCSLCNRRLAPTRDIYMYRGNSAFCSIECRQQQMTQDERKENSIKKESNSSSSHSAVATSTKGEKIVA